MKPVAIVQHDPHDGPSYFATWLVAQGIAFELFCMYDGAHLPANLDQHSGLCILGGPMSANDPLAYYPPLFGLVQEALQRRVPVIGHCLGGQLLSRALGGAVQAAEHTEIGWSLLEPVHPEASAWFGDPPLHLFQWHSESFSIPAQAIQLLRGSYCANQAYCVDDLHLGMQFHCEVDAAKVRRWLVLGAEEMRACNSPGVQTTEAILARLDADLRNSQRIADRIYTRWVQGLRR